MKWSGKAALVACAIWGCATAVGERTRDDGTSPVDAGNPGNRVAPASMSANDAAGSTARSASCVTAAQLRAWQSEIDLFDGGNRPTGSPAHEQYIQLLARELQTIGVHDVHTEPFVFPKWTPKTWSLSVLSGAGAATVATSAYVPYSGTTGPLGVVEPLAYVPGWTISLDAGSLASDIQNPNAWTERLANSIGGSLVAEGGMLAGHIVVFELPKLRLSLELLTGLTLAVNDPDKTISMKTTFTRDDLTAMFIVPAMEIALAAHGAIGAIGILDSPEEGARGEYAPFFGRITPNLPSLYVDREVGAKLQRAITSSRLAPVARLVLDATVAPAISENLIGVLPGSSTEEIVVGSHTDGPNAIEDNGPVAILALAQCLAPLPVEVRPRTIRIVLSGGHFAASVGLTTYTVTHAADLAARALAVMRAQHLGAREWAELTPGVMGLTGRIETQVVSASPSRRS